MTLERKRSSYICRNYRSENTIIWEHHYDFRKATQVKKIPTAVNSPEKQVFRDDSSAGPTIKLMKNENSYIFLLPRAMGGWTR